MQKDLLYIHTHTLFFFSLLFLVHLVQLFPGLFLGQHPAAHGLCRQAAVPAAVVSLQASAGRGPPGCACAEGRGRHQGAEGLRDQQVRCAQAWKETLI